MKIFISWSGNKSQEVAKILKQWIPCVIQSVEPYFSSADIDKGARWSTDIAKELQDASFGILCVTKDNLSSSWLNFEAGALSKSIEQSKVCPFLVDLKPSDITDSPILQFQMANATRDDVFKLFKSINLNLGDTKLSEDVLSTTFDTFWPKIEESLKAVASITDTATTIKKETKDAQEPIEEILELIRYQHKLLKSPTDLLPPDYLMDVFQKIETIHPNGYYEEIEMLMARISMATEDILRNFSIDEEQPKFTQQLMELRELSQRVRMLIRRVR